MASNNDIAKKLTFAPKTCKPHSLSQFEKTMNPSACKAFKTLDNRKNIPFEKLAFIAELLK